jgi:hypothetical protein
MASSVDPSVEVEAVLARLRTLSGDTYDGVPQGFKLPVDAWGKKTPYRDFEAGSTIPSAQQRLLAANEQQQPNIWAFQIHHYGATRDVARNLSIESDVALLGWAPSANSGPISTFYFTIYDETAKNGERIGFIATRFYEVTLGLSPDYSLVI